MAKFQMVVMVAAALAACKKDSSQAVNPGSAAAMAGSGSAKGSAAPRGSAAPATPGVDTPVDAPALNPGAEVEGVAVRHKPPRHPLHVAGSHPKEKVKIELFAKMGESGCNPDSSILLKLVDKDSVVVDAWLPFFPKDAADWTKQDKTYDLVPGDYAIKLEVGCAMGPPTTPTSHPYKMRATLVTQ